MSKVPAPNYTQCPNVIFDYWLPILGFAELKIFMVIIRKTFGWHKIKDRISLSQLQKLTGISGKHHILKAIQDLEERKLIKKEIEGIFGEENTYYSLIINEEPVTLSNPPPVTQSNPPPVTLSDSQKKGSLKKNNNVVGNGGNIPLPLEQQFTKSDLYFSCSKLKKDWSPEEMESAYEKYSISNQIISDPLKYIEGIINKTRINSQNNNKKDKICTTTDLPQKKKPLSQIRAPEWAQMKTTEFMEKPKNFLIYCGNPGIGKTFLCSCLIDWAITNFRSFRYWNESELLKKVRSSIEDFKGDYLETLKYLIDDDLIFLDDIGSTGLNEWRKEIIFDAVDERYCSMKPTIITTNFSMKELEKNFPERVSSRLLAKENTIIEILDGTDLRRN